MFVSYLGGQLYCKSGLWVRFPFEDINYLILSFSRCGNEVNRGVEFRHSTRNASRIRRKVGDTAICGIQREAEIK